MLGAGVLIAILAVGRPIDLHAQRSLEYEVKAAFLYNFFQFVEWPPEALRAPACPGRFEWRGLPWKAAPLARRRFLSGIRA